MSLLMTILATALNYHCITHFTNYSHCIFLQNIPIVLTRKETVFAIWNALLHHNNSSCVNAVRRIGPPESVNNGLPGSTLTYPALGDVF